MNTRRNTWRRVEEAAFGANQAPPQYPTARVLVLVKPVALPDREVREQIVQMVQAITTHAHDIIAQATSEGACRENPHASTMASRLRDLTRMNPPIYYHTKTNKDPNEFVDDIHKILSSMSVN